MLTGKLESGDKTVNIRDGRLMGKEITFRINDRLYTGAVTGNRMEGKYKEEGTGEKKWAAVR